MKALMYDGPHQLRLMDLPEPIPDVGEVKLRVGGCGICGSDVHGYTGESGRRTAGQVMGHEFAGHIAELGGGVQGWRVGDRVAAYNIVGCGACRFCKSGDPQCCLSRKVIGVNTGVNGAFAEFVCVPAENLAPLSDRIPYTIALLNEPLAVSYHALRHLPADSTTIVVIGGGTIGQCLVKVAQVLGGRRVYLLEPVEEKRQMAEAAGAIALPPDLELLQQRLPEGADAAVEAVGLESTVLCGLNAIRPGGTLVLLGNLAKTVTLPLQHISNTEKKLVGTYGFNADDFRQVVRWINDGKFALEPMISGTLGLAEAPAAFADLAAGRRQAVKLVVEP